MPKKAFSLIELSIAVLIIGILIAGVTQGSKLLSKASLKSAQSITQSSPVLGIKGLTAWYESTQEKSFGGSLPENSGLVTTWYDINARITTFNATQSDSSLQPRFIENCFNRLPCLRFNGNPYFSTPFVNIKKMTIFVVGQLELGIFFVISAGQVNNTGTQMIRSNTNFHYRYVSDQGTLKDILEDPSGLSGYHIFNQYYDGTRFYAYRDNQLRGSITASINTNVLNRLTIGRPAALNTNFALTGDIAELIIYDRSLKNEERTAVTEYLSKKWNISI